MPQPGELTFPILQQSLAGVLLVTDEELVETLGFVLERMKVLVEPSGVAGAAAVRHRKANFAGRRVGVILSGGNVDREKLAQYLVASAAPGNLKSGEPGPKTGKRGGARRQDAGMKRRKR